jgi:drug/metabolite transporter (DMT)-like permease
MRTDVSGLGSIYLATFLLAINGVLCKSIDLDAVSITALRCAIALVALLAFAYWHAQPWGYASPKRRALVVFLGLLMGLHWACFFQAIQVSTVAIGILAHFSAPVVTVLLEPLLDRRWPLFSDLLAALGVLVGLAIMVPHWSLDSQMLWGILFGLCSALAMACRNVFQRRWLQGESSTQGMVVQVAVAALLCAPFTAVDQALALPGVQWVYILLLGLISTALAHTLVVVSLQQLSAKTVGLISCFQPPLAIAMGWLFLAETPSLRTCVGGALILGCAGYEAWRVRPQALPEASGR